MNPEKIPQPLAFNETYSFRRISWKTIRSIYGLVVVPIGTFYILQTFKWALIPSFIILGFLVISAFFLFSVYGLMTRIIISPEGITCKTPLKTFYYSWDEFQRIGMFVKEQNGKFELPVQRYFERFYLREKFVFLSKEPSFNSHKLAFPRKDYLDFHYNQKAWELILLYTKIKHTAASAYLYPPDSDPGFGH